MTGRLRCPRHDSELEEQRRGHWLCRMCHQEALAALPRFDAFPSFVAETLKAAHDPRLRWGEAADPARRGVEAALRWLALAALAENFASAQPSPSAFFVLQDLQQASLSQWAHCARRLIAAQGGELAMQWRALDAKQGNASLLETVVKLRNDWAHSCRSGEHPDDKQAERLVAEANALSERLGKLLETAGYELRCGAQRLHGAPWPKTKLREPLLLRSRSHDEITLSPLCRVLDSETGEAQLAVLAGYDANKRELLYETASSKLRAPSDELESCVEQLEKRLSFSPDSWFAFVREQFKQQHEPLEGQSAWPLHSLALPQKLWTEYTGEAGATQSVALARACLRREWPTLFFTSAELRSSRPLEEVFRQRLPFVKGSSLVSMLNECLRITKTERQLVLFFDGLRRSGSRARELARWVAALEQTPGLERLRLVGLFASEEAVAACAMGAMASQALKSVLLSLLGGGGVLRFGRLLAEHGFLPVAACSDEERESLREWCERGYVLPRFDAWRLLGYDFRDESWSLALLSALQRMPESGCSAPGPRAVELWREARRFERGFWQSDELRAFQAESSRLVEAQPRPRPVEQPAEMLRAQPAESSGERMAPSWRLLLEPKTQAVAFVEACDWAESIELYLAWLEQGDHWGPRWAQLQAHETKLRRVVTALTGFRSEPALLERLYASNKLRLVTSSDASFAPNLLLFRAGKRLRAFLSSEPFSSTLLHESIQHMVLFEADADARQAVELLDFCRRCREQASVPEASFLRGYAERRAAMQAFLSTHIAQPKLCRVEPSGALQRVSERRELAACVQRLREEAARASGGARCSARLDFGTQQRLNGEVFVFEALSFCLAVEDDAHGRPWLFFGALPLGAESLRGVRLSESLGDAEAELPCAWLYRDEAHRTLLLTRLTGGEQAVAQCRASSVVLEGLGWCQCVCVLESPQLIAHLAGYLQELRRVALMLAMLAENDGEEETDASSKAAAEPPARSRGFADESELETSALDDDQVRVSVLNEGQERSLSLAVDTPDVASTVATWLSSNEAPKALDWRAFLSKTGVERRLLEQWSAPVALSSVFEWMNEEPPQRLSSKRFASLLATLAAAALELSLDAEEAEQLCAVEPGAPSPGIAAWIRLRLEPSAEARNRHQTRGWRGDETESHELLLRLLRLWALGLWLEGDWTASYFSELLSLRGVYSLVLDEQVQRISRRRVVELQSALADLGLQLLDVSGEALGDGPLPQYVALHWR